MVFILPGGLGQNFAKTAASAFDPANTSSGVTLSNNNLTATYVSGSIGSARGIKSINFSGVANSARYFEVTCTIIDASGNTGVAVVNSSFALGTSLSVGANSAGILAATGSFWTEWSAGAPGMQGTAPANGDVIGVAVSNWGFIWMSINGVFFSTPDATSTSPGSDFQPLTQPVFPLVNVYTSAGIKGSFILNTGGSAFKYTPPAGFTAWR